MVFRPETMLQLISLFTLGLFAIVLKFIFDSRRAGLSHIPGPFLARYTDAWRLYQAVRGYGKQEYLSSRLRKTYGEVARIGPTTVAVFDPAAVPTIYGTGSRLNKGDGYLAFAPAGATTTLLTNLDEESHAKYKRPVANAYSLSALKIYEPNVDRVISELVNALSEKAAKNEVINLSRWCHYYAYDVIGMLTFGQSLGFLKTGQDIHGMVKLTKGATYYAGVASTMPWLDRFLKMTFGRRLGSGSFGLYVRDRVKQRLQDKLAKMEASKPDLVGHFASAQEKYPDIMTDHQIGVLCAGNLFAGSQSPSHVLDTICNFLASNPSGQRQLYIELTDIKCTYPATLQQVQSLPYLDGVIREGYRLHGMGFFILERMTPAAGLTLPSGHHLPPGIKIGTSSHGLSRREDVFGYDCEEFKPERWVRQTDESEEVFARRRLAMERCDMTFGYGSRVCIGKNIATLELYKAVATLVGLFEFDLVGCPKMFEVNVRVRKRSA